LTKRVRLYGGDITVKSQKGKGSVFTTTLPDVLVEGNAPADAQVSRHMKPTLILRDGVRLREMPPHAPHDGFRAGKRLLGRHGRNFF